MVGPREVTERVYGVDASREKREPREGPNDEKEGRDDDGESLVLQWLHRVVCVPKRDGNAP